MKLTVLTALLALTLLLSGCGGQTSDAAAPAPAPSPSPEAAPTPSPAAPEESVLPEEQEPLVKQDSEGSWYVSYVHLSELAQALAPYEELLSQEEWQALSGFFPVLRNEVPMLTSIAGSRVTPTEEVFFLDIYESYAPESGIPSESYGVNAFTLAPVAGETLDLVLSCRSLGGWYLLIHQDRENFYGLYFSVRWFEMLQTDGLYAASSGAASNYYFRLHFENGTFTEELLGNTDWGDTDAEGRYLGYYAIGGEEVTQAVFDAWLEELLVGDAQWYPVAGR